MSERIEELSREEEELWERAGDGDGLSAEEQARLAAIRSQLDALRQRDEGDADGGTPPPHPR
ncbi:MAG TPA: DUF2630 family protein [Candidatus Limnocylindrales bacterium]|nr:DUF2630 family protein [Candidatus Limnocylindrales bacterium]